MSRFKAFLLETIFFMLIVSCFTLNAIEGLSLLSFGLACFFFLLASIFYGQVSFVKPFIPVACLLVLNFLTLFNEGRLDYVEEVFSACFIGYIVFMGLQRGVDINMALWGMALSGVINILFFYLLKEPSVSAEGLLGNANALAIFLCLSAFSIYFLSLKRAIWIKLLAFNFLIFALLYTGSRKAVALVGLILILIYIDYLWRGSGARRFLRSLLVILLTIVLSGIFFHKYSDSFKQIYAWKRVENIIFGEKDHSFEARQAMIRRGMELWHEKPVLGWGGSGGFTEVGGFDTYAHNNYVEVLVNHGAVGFCLYYAFYISLLVLGWRSRDNYFSRIGFLMVVMLLILDWSCVSLGSKTAWIFLGLATHCVCSTRAKPKVLGP